jgi:ribosome-binding factor A
VTPDMREAKVIVSVMGSEAQQRTVLKGLQNSVGFLQSKIADRIETRYIPRLSFVIDDGVKKSVAVQQILEQIAKERAGDASQEALDDASIDEILDELGPDGEFEDEESQEDDKGKNRRKN